MSFLMKTPGEISKHIAKKSQAKRLSFNFSQRTLAERSGVSYGVLKKFERTGQISFGSLLKVAFALGCLEEFDDLFSIPEPEHLLSLDELMSEKTRKRGRR